MAASWWYAGFSGHQLRQCRHPGDSTHPGGRGWTLGRGPGGAMGAEALRDHTELRGCFSTDPRQVAGAS